ncbi:MAG: D-3-phosphoglycerate dehydrogenase / 2-oxoglutarate reductase [Thermosediminibacterales bacterium]|nr:D-3-phosphoglycerate dehydrogenase / 2-oxoglutarate reductase [Thermosediminibacterales bacterium]
MKVIITEKIHDSGIEILKKYADVDCKFGISREELLENIEKYDAMIVRVGIQIDKEIIDKGKNLKAIGMAGIGLNHIDVEYAKQKGIGVFNVPDGSNNSVAELTMALMLNIARKVNAAVNSVKFNNEWDKHAYVGRQLKDKVLGILALGKIGSRVAKFAQAFDMKVIAYDPFIDKTKAEEINVELVELDELLQRADIVSIHTPLTKQTYHLIGDEQIKKMKKGAFLLNLGRGGVVDEESLYKALKEGHLAGAAVDVMEQEPPGKSKLFELDNFIATPHIGAGTIEAQEYISKSIAEKILSHLGLI